MNYKTLFDVDLAILPILIAKWTNDPFNATIVYQNGVLRNKLGSWENSKLVELLDSNNFTIYTQLVYKFMSAIG